MANDQYRYEAFSQPQLEARILTLLPSKERTAPLLGRLSVESMKPRAPRYEALSYVWGDGATRYPLFIGNEELPISGNLQQALRRLRHPNVARDLWIDAVCIDQSSSDEKKFQVQQMYDIYTSATRVLIWLGEGDEASDQAMRILKEQGFAQAFDRAVKIFERPWWNRVWTLQEGLAAKSDALMICGEEAIPWFLVHYAMIQLVMMDPRLRIFPGVGAFSDVNTNRSRGRTTLEDLVYASLSREGTDPRDNIYALLGLVQKSRHPVFDPDYTKSTSWAYANATAHIIEQRMDLEFLALRFRQKTTMEPSWSYDFSNKAVLRQTAGQSGTRELSRAFFATIGRQHHFEFGYGTAWNVVKILGTVVGTITSVLTPSTGNICQLDKQEGYEQNRRVAVLIDAVSTFTEACRLSWRKRPPYLDAEVKISLGDVWRTVAGGCHTSDEELWNVICGRSDEYSVMANLISKDDKRSDSPNRRAFQEVERLTEACIDRKCFFITDTHFAGCGSIEVQLGDMLCILFGCKLPLILRARDDGTYRIIDGVYVDGIMTGDYFRRYPKCRDVCFTIT
jgi:hypothetical protein